MHSSHFYSYTQSYNKFFLQYFTVASVIYAKGVCKGISRLSLFTWNETNMIDLILAVVK